MKARRSESTPMAAAQLGKQWRAECPLQRVPPPDQLPTLRRPSEAPATVAKASESSSSTLLLPGNVSWTHQNPSLGRTGIEHQESTLPLHHRCSSQLPASHVPLRTLSSQQRKGAHVPVCLHPMSSMISTPRSPISLSNNLDLSIHKTSSVRSAAQTMTRKMNAKTLATVPAASSATSSSAASTIATVYMGAVRFGTASELSCLVKLRTTLPSIGEPPSRLSFSTPPMDSISCSAAKTDPGTVCPQPSWARSSR